MDKEHQKQDQADETDKEHQKTLEKQPLQHLHMGKETKQQDEQVATQPYEAETEPKVTPQPQPPPPSQQPQQHHQEEDNLPRPHNKQQPPVQPQQHMGGAFFTSAA